MQIVTEPKTLQQTCLRWRADGLRIALVPTMGYYHAGHESLMRAAREAGDKVVVSLFVNPAQFGPAEDLASYPRDLERDAATAKEAGADILFVPRPDDMYPEAFGTWVDVPDLSSHLCGQSRPGHFRGVATVVAKLFMLAQPACAFFGMKDWQQLAVLRRMAADLNIPCELVACPIVREADGLAMSSRNIYLSVEERAQAPHLYKGLQAGRELVLRGETNAEAVARAIRDYWRAHLPLGVEDYLSIVDPATLQPLTHIGLKALAACAVRLGKARLIDNIFLAEGARPAADPL